MRSLYIPSLWQPQVGLEKNPARRQLPHHLSNTISKVTKFINVFDINKVTLKIQIFWCEIEFWGWKLHLAYLSNKIISTCIQYNMIPSKGNWFCYFNEFKFSTYKELSKFSGYLGAQMWWKCITYLQFSNFILVVIKDKHSFFYNYFNRKSNNYLSVS